MFYLHDPIPTADGQYRIISTQDSDGGTKYGPPVNYTVDSLAPSTTIVSGPTSPGSSSSAHFVFSGTDPDPPNGHASGIDYFDCRIDGQPSGWDHCTDPGGSAPYTYDVSGLSEGGHTLEVRALDKAEQRGPESGHLLLGGRQDPA